MKEQEIHELSEELARLSRQLASQQQRIMQIQQRLSELTSVPPPQHHASHTTFKWSPENFIGLKLIQFIGIIVLVIGLSIGVKYAIDRNLISEAMRIMLAYGAGIVLLLLSFRLRKNYTLFSAILFSGGMASLYFTTYGAYVYYDMFSFGLAFAIMILFTFYSVFEAMRYNRQEIALLALVGAYGIPFLISKNADRADLFFLYITVINIGVVFLSIRKQWKMVGRVAQVITWILFLGWAASRYRSEVHYTIAIFYMSLFFLEFLFTTLSFRMVHKQNLTISDTYQLVLNNMALYVAALFIFGYAQDTDIAMITIVLAGIVALQSFIIYQYWKTESFTARTLASLALVLFVLFIAFNWTGFIVTLLWLLTSVIVVTWGFIMKSVAARMMAMVLMGVTLLKLVALDSLTFTTVQKVIAYLILGVLLLVVSFFYQKFRQRLFGEDKS